jgi:hypothetical protein
MAANPAVEDVVDPIEFDACADLMAALQDFKAEVDEIQQTPPTGTSEDVVAVPYSEAEWLSHLELKFVLRTLRKEALKSLGDVAMAATNVSPATA